MIGEKIFEDLKNAVIELDDEKAVKGAKDMVAQEIGGDGYAATAGQAVTLAEELIAGKK